MRGLFVDIGSNSIRSMKAEYVINEFSFFDKHIYTTRLAEGILRTGNLSLDRVFDSLSILKQIKLFAKEENISIYAYATSAIRDAKNSTTFLVPACDILSTNIDVLSGEQEARYAFLGATNGKGSLIDIGGGSTQVITKDYAASFPFGCVRAKDACRNASFVQSSFHKIYDTLWPLLIEHIPVPLLTETSWTGVGGTITTLAAFALGLPKYDSSRVDGCLLSFTAAKNALETIADMGKASAMHHLLSMRHDVILQGGAILLYLMEHLSIDHLHISDADGLEGYAMHILYYSTKEN